MGKLPLPLEFKLRYPFFFFLSLLSLIRAPTVIEIANVRTIKEGFLERFIDLIMYMACPCCSSGAGFYLRRKLEEDGAKVRCAFATEKRVSGGFQMRKEGERLRGKQNETSKMN